MFITDALESSSSARRPNGTAANTLTFFPGYYYLQCMLQMVARKQEVVRLRRSEDGVFVVDNSLVGVQGNFIGKEISLHDF